MVRAVTSVQACVPNVTKNVLIVNRKAFAEAVAYALTALVAKVISAPAVKPALTVQITSVTVVTVAPNVLISVLNVLNNVLIVQVTFVLTAVNVKPVWVVADGVTTAMFAVNVLKRSAIAVTAAPNVQLSALLVPNTVITVMRISAEVVIPVRSAVKQADGVTNVITAVTVLRQYAIAVTVAPIALQYVLIVTKNALTVQIPIYAVDVTPVLTV